MRCPVGGRSPLSGDWLGAGGETRARSSRQAAAGGPTGTSHRVPRRAGRRYLDHIARMAPSSSHISCDARVLPGVARGSDSARPAASGSSAPWPVGATGPQHWGLHLPQSPRHWLRWRRHAGCGPPGALSECFCALEHELRHAAQLAHGQLEVTGTVTHGTTSCETSSRTDCGPRVIGIAMKPITPTAHATIPNVWNTRRRPRPGASSRLGWSQTQPGAGPPRWGSVGRGSRGPLRANTLRVDDTNLRRAVEAAHIGRELPLSGELIALMVLSIEWSSQLRDPHAACH